jgi:hypothetical protein
MAELPAEPLDQLGGIASPLGERLAAALTERGRERVHLPHRRGLVVPPIPLRAAGGSGASVGVHALIEPARLARMCAGFVPEG